MSQHLTGPSDLLQASALLSGILALYLFYEAPCHAAPRCTALRWQVLVSGTVMSELRAPKLLETVSLQPRLLRWVARCGGRGRTEGGTGPGSRPAAVTDVERAGAGRHWPLVLSFSCSRLA